MQITYVTAFNQKNIHNWSGLGFYYGKMLCEAGFTEVQSIDVTAKAIPLRPLHWVELKFNSVILGKSRPALYDLKKAQGFAELIDSKKHSSRVISPNTVALACLNGKFKKILYTDSTLDNLLTCYPNYYHLDRSVVEQAERLESAAIANADLLIYTSSWAANSAIEKYGAKPERVFIVPFGANMQNVPGFGEVEDIIKARDIEKRIHLLFVGVEWERKGGERAVQVAEALNAMGYPTTLHIVGLRNLKKHVQKDFIVDYGYISKQTPSGERQLRQLMSKCTFLILPSLADCTPVVFSEASAFGLPSVATNVGGNSSVIQPGVNGNTFPLESFVDDSVQFISGLCQAPAEYRNLCFSAFEAYENNLNWRSSGRKIYDLVKEL